VIICCQAEGLASAIICVQLNHSLLPYTQNPEPYTLVNLLHQPLDFVCDVALSALKFTDPVSYRI